MKMLTTTKPGAPNQEQSIYRIFWTEPIKLPVQLPAAPNEHAYGLHASSEANLIRA